MAEVVGARASDGWVGEVLAGRPEGTKVGDAARKLAALVIGAAVGAATGAAGAVGAAVGSMPFGAMMLRAAVGAAVAKPIV